MKPVNELFEESLTTINEFVNKRVATEEALIDWYYTQFVDQFNDALKNLKYENSGLKGYYFNIRLLHGAYDCYNHHHKMIGSVSDHRADILRSRISKYISFSPLICIYDDIYSNSGIEIVIEIRVDV